MKAILIDVEFSVGLRAGGVRTDDPNLRCSGMQDFVNGREIRFVIDENVEPYYGRDGITVLEDVEAIAAATSQFDRPDQHSIDYEHIAAEYIRQKGIDITGLALNGNLPKQLYELGVAGVSFRPAKPLDVEALKKLHRPWLMKFNQLLGRPLDTPAAPKHAAAPGRP